VLILVQANELLAQMLISLLSFSIHKGCSED